MGLDVSTKSPLWPRQDSIGEIQKFHQSMESFLHDLVVVAAVDIIFFGCPTKLLTVRTLQKRQQVGLELSKVYKTVNMWMSLRVTDSYSK